MTTSKWATLALAFCPMTMASHMSVGSGGNEIFVRLDHDEARDVAMLLLTAARGIN
jgi:hypothetical protein